MTNASFVSFALGSRLQFLRMIFFGGGWKCFLFPSTKNLRSVFLLIKLMVTNDLFRVNIEMFKKRTVSEIKSKALTELHIIFSNLSLCGLAFNEGHCWVINCECACVCVKLRYPTYQNHVLTLIRQTLRKVRYKQCVVLCLKRFSGWKIPSESLKACHIVTIYY